jgi:hypothetical protein
MRGPGKDGRRELSARIGEAANSQRITVNISGEAGNRLHEIASQCGVSESSVVEIALRQLFRRVSPPALKAFLRANGACLRRPKS